MLAALSRLEKAHPEEPHYAYLEASAPRNKALYERHGFEVTESSGWAETHRRCGGCGAAAERRGRDSNPRESLRPLLA
jgi:hypothetical protein